MTQKKNLQKDDMMSNQEKDVWIIEINGPATRYNTILFKFGILFAMGSDRLVQRNTFHGSKNMGAFSTTTICIYR